MELLFVVLSKHSAVDIVSYICCMHGDFLDNGVTNHVCISACVVVQFAQKYNVLALFTIALCINWLKCLSLLCRQKLSYF